MDRGIYQIGRSLGVQKNYFIEYETYEQYVVKIAIPGESEVDNINWVCFRFPLLPHFVLVSH